MGRRPQSTPAHLPAQGSHVMRARRSDGPCSFVALDLIYTSRATSKLAPLTSYFELTLAGGHDRVVSNLGSRHDIHALYGIARHRKYPKQGQTDR